MLESKISDPELERIKKQVTEITDVDLQYFKSSFLKRRVADRMKAISVKSGSEYAQLLESDPLESLTLYDKLSVNVTRFFRDPTVWENIAFDCLPRIIKNRPSEIAIWSAGCATGQEPYSLAMMLNESVEGKNIQFNISATDISRTAITVAESGKFDHKSLEGFPAEGIKKYFEKLPDGIYKMKNELKSKINFEVADILSYPAKKIDVIMCRNVLIYYGFEAKNLLFKKFYNSLNDKGFLILGMNESMVGTNGGNFFDSYNLRYRIFQKK